MQTERSLSDFWREDKSDDRVRELASVLRGADSLIGVMGSGVRATWSINGQSQTWWLMTKQGQPAGMRVILDYSPIADLRPPFSGQPVDEVIGYAAHEGGHCLWSDGDSRRMVEEILQRRTMPTTRASRPHNEKDANCQCPVCEILRVGNIIEDAFIDFHVGEEWPVLGEYIRWARTKTWERRPIDFDAIARESRPSRNAIINLWIACSLYDAPLPAKMSAKVKRAMTFLMGKSVQAVKTSHASVRLDLAVACWEYLAQEFPQTDEPLPRQAPPPMPAPPSAPSGGQGEGEGQTGEGAAGDEQQGQGRSGKKSDDSQDDTEAEGSSKGADTGDEQGEEGEDEAGGAEGDQADETGEPEAEGEGEAEPEDEAGDDTGDTGDTDDTEGEEEGEEAGGQPEGGEQGGDEQGAPGNLDEFDIRDLGEVPDEVIEGVLDAIAHELEDLSKSVAEALDIDPSRVAAQTKKADYDGPAANRVRAEVEPQIQEMRRVFDRQAQVKSRQIKGMTTGKLDSRNLARVGTGSLRVYKRREVLDKPDLAVGLLLDVSGSMSGSMSTVWATGCVFAEALIRKPGVNFLCLTYTGGGSWLYGGADNVQTTRICDREMGQLCIGNVDQGGGTPSGPAIASIKTLMDRMPERQRVIIHFTDGSPDSATSTVKAVENARKAGYAVWAIGVRGLEQTLRTQYGDGNWETIADIRELPAKVLSLVQRLVITR
jgi:hypothetical protein